MVANFHPPKPIPADPLGQRLHELFGRNLWDFIEAPAPAPDGKPQWRTVTHYQMRPRILWQRWQDPDTLIGVRFESQTRYGLLDIDAGSPYCNAGSIAVIRAALETLGITRTLLLRSSHSNGLHLYLPLPEPVKTFDLAVALEACLTAQDFPIANGKLEIFPNPKPYGVEKIIHYNGHRLPLQPGTGSYLLDDDLNPIGDQLDRFFWLWDGAASHQDMDELRHALKIGRDNRRKKPKRSPYPSSSTVAVWQHDLETEINDGWSGPGQTNHLLKSVACHGRVFLGLAGDDLFNHSLETAIHLPGYQQYCHHQQDIHHRVKVWCKSVEGYYWPLGNDPKRDTTPDQPPKPSVNQQRAEDARQRIESAIAQLRQLSTLPLTIRDIAQQIAAIAHCSLQTVYKHLTLWHPDHTPTPEKEHVTAQPESNPALSSAAELSPTDPPKPLSEGVLHTQEGFMKCVRSRDAGSDQSEAMKHTRGMQGDFSLPAPSSVPSCDFPIETPTSLPESVSAQVPFDLPAFVRELEARLPIKLRRVHHRRLQTLGPQRWPDVRMVVDQILQTQAQIDDLSRYFTAALNGLIQGTWDVLPVQCVKRDALLSPDQVAWLDVAEQRGLIVAGRRDAGGYFCRLHGSKPDSWLPIANQMVNFPLAALAEHATPLTRSAMRDLLNQSRRARGLPPLPEDW
jgi:hypothetical protein